MHFFPLRANFGASLWILFVACAASLINLAQAEIVEWDFGSVTKQTSYQPTVVGNVKFKVYTGCPDVSKTYTLSTPNGNVNMTTARLQKYEYTSANETFAMQGTYGPGPAGFNVQKNYTFSLIQSGTPTPVDTQTVTIKVSGTMYFGAGGAAVPGIGEQEIVITLKPGGPAAGKSRIDNNHLDPEEPDEGQLLDVFSYLPNYNPVTGDLITPKGVTGPNGVGMTIPVGAGWQRIRVGSGTVPSPTWLNSAGNVAESGIGSGKGYFVSPNLTASGGDPVTVPDFHWSTGANGTNVSGGVPGNTLDLNFPKGYVPKETDMRGEQPTPPSSLNLDPCFAYAAADNGLPPPGVGPEDPNTPVDVTPPEIPLPGTPPTQPGLEPGTVLPPGIVLPPGGGGTGGGGGTVTTPGGGGGGGAGGGGIVVTPPTAPEGKAPAQPGQGLPDDDAAQAHSDGLADRFRNGVGQIQDALGGLLGKGKISPPNFNPSADWTLTITINGQVHSIVIPTQHAHVIRAIFKLLFTAIFLLACYNLFFGK